MGRRWRLQSGNGDGVLPTTIRSDSYQEAEILDTQEQEALVHSFERKDEFQNLLWRGIFAAFAVSLALFFIHSAHQQAVDPWSIKYHAVFSSTLNSTHLIFTNLAEAGTCANIAAGMFSSARWRRKMLLGSCICGSLLAFFQLNRMSKFKWDLVWLPLAVPSLAAICIYVDKVLAETAKDIQALRASIYHYKRS